MTMGRLNVKVVAVWQITPLPYVVVVSLWARLLAYSWVRLINIAPSYTRANSHVYPLG
jgi:hypothetical protein